MTLSSDKRLLPYGGSFAIMDPNVLQQITDIPQTDPKKFCEKYLDWITSGTLNTFSGIENFPITVFCNGTTEAFDKFYMKNNQKRFRCFKGEYMYHQVTWRNHWPDWKFIEDEPLKENDAVVISLPFSDTGNQHDYMHNVLEKCTELSIPVLLDCAYFGTCSGIHFDFNHDCITDITFSLSKAFPIAYARVGMRLTRIDDDDPLLMLNKIGYINCIGAALGLQLIENFSSDYIVNKYKSKQLYLCKQLEIIPSNTVLFGLDTNNKFPEYNRGGTTNRLGLYKHYV